MKTTLLAISIVLLVTPFTILAQSPALVAKFGVDGELANDTMRLGPGNPVGSHDWLKQKSGIGIGLVDTVGTSIYNPLILSGGNISFTRGQSVSRYAIVDNMYMLDTRYGRDGIGAGGAIKDSTVFAISNKNGQSPLTWAFETNGGGVQNKNDIVDVYAHMRRNGTTINSTNPSPLYLMAGASTLGTDGDRYIDFELYKSRIGFNRSTGFSNSGSSTTGGHSVWTFNADGTVKTTGDMLVSFSYTSSNVTDVAVFIWVSKTNKDNVNPFYFDFIPSEYFGDGSNPAYGYCRITQNSGLPNFEFYATTNNFTSTGPFWGTNSKDLGGSGSNYAAINYGAGQFSEIAINFTSLGIDPALGNAGSTTDPCAPPFTRIMVKTRSSNSYTSELKDFTGPYPFLDAPQVPHQIAPANFTCTNNTTTLAPLYPQADAFYTWSTAGGNILSNPVAQSVTVSGEGKYYLTASIVTGCLGLTDSIILTRDTYQPVATAATEGWVNLLYPGVLANLIGGNDSASNYWTPYGFSSGLTWEWSGPVGYTATTKNATTNLEGTFMLVVTELRNGCKDTAYTPVYSSQTLPVHLVRFQGNMNKNNKVTLNWTVADNETVNSFEVERSFNGKDFTTVGVVLASEKIGTENYMFYETVSGNDKVMYRLKMIDKGHDIDYSRILIFETKILITNDIKVYGNPVKDKLTFSYYTNATQQVSVKVYDLTGKILMSQKVNSAEGSNMLSLPLNSTFKPGVYVVEVFNGSNIQVAKFVKQ